MDVASEEGSAKIPRMALTMKRDLPGEEKEDEDGESSSGNAQSLVQKEQGGGCGKWPRTGTATHEESQAAVETGADSSSRRVDDMQSNTEVSPAAHAAEIHR